MTKRTKAKRIEAPKEVWALRVKGGTGLWHFDDVEPLTRRDYDVRKFIPEADPLARLKEDVQKAAIVFIKGTRGHGINSPLGLRYLRTLINAVERLERKR